MILVDFRWKKSIPYMFQNIFNSSANLHKKLKIKCPRNPVQILDFGKNEATFFFSKLCSSLNVAYNLYNTIENSNNLFGKGCVHSTVVSLDVKKISWTCGKTFCRLMKTKLNLFAMYSKRHIWSKHNTTHHQKNIIPVNCSK